MAGEDTFDVAVVGGGGAGLAAAVSAAQAGANVVLVEKDHALGGSTAWSVGSVSVNRSPHQRQAGVNDSSQAHFEDMEQFAGPLANRDNRVLRTLLVENISETFDWLLSMGLVFVGPNLEPPHRVPRMHNILPSSRAFTQQLSIQAKKLGVTIRLDAEVSELIQDEGRVAGIKTVSALDGSNREVHARATILAGGDYSAGRALLTEFAGPEAAKMVPVNRGATGAGIQLGRSVGGTVINGDLVRGPVLRFVPPPSTQWWHRLPTHPWVGHGLKAAFDYLPHVLTRPFLMRFLTTALGLSSNVLAHGAVLVNRESERYCDEQAGAAMETVRQTGGEGFVLFDHDIAEKLNAWPNFISTAPGVAYAYLDDYQRARRDIFFKADSVEMVAQLAGLPSELHRTIQDYNTEQSNNGRPTLTRPPFYLLGPIKAYLPFTEGGLAVDEWLRVTDEGGQPISGLYAAGSNGQGGLLLEGHGHHLGWAFVSGRLAGAHAAAHDPHGPHG